MVKIYLICVLCVCVYATAHTSRLIKKHWNSENIGLLKYDCVSFSLHSCCPVAIKELRIVHGQSKACVVILLFIVVVLIV